MNHLSLFELNGLIKSALDNNLAPSYWVVCEISDLRENQRGHCYLELVEKEGDEVIAKMRGLIRRFLIGLLSIMVVRQCKPLAASVALW